MKQLFRLAAPCLLIAATAGCATAAGEAWVELKGARFTVEVANDDAERERGLMFRDEMAADRGMIFVHEDEEPQAYWMKNTKIPLDIFYFDAQRKLVSVQERVPPCSLGDRCPPFPSDGPAKYVLELNAGAAEKLKVSPGDELLIGPGVTAEK